jgi:hypothetical protein
MESNELKDLIERNLERQLGWIRAADSRGGMAAALSTAMLGVLAAVSPPWEGWRIAPAIFVSFAAVLLLLSLVCLTMAAFPRVTGPRGSLIFFGGIAQRTEEQFEREILTMGGTSYLEDLIKQCHRNAEIASRKFHYVQWALIFLYSAVAPWAIAVLLLYSAT